MSSGFGTSSTCASSGSPPGSNLAADEIQDWTYTVHGAVDVDPVDDEAGIDSCSSGAVSRVDHHSHAIAHITELLKDSDWEVRRFATERFGKRIDRRKQTSLPSDVSDNRSQVASMMP
jgi:HEAT repeat protein